MSRALKEVQARIVSEAGSPAFALRGFEFPLLLVLSSLVYIQENSAAFNIMVGVLCNALACSPEMQQKVADLGKNNEVLTQSVLMEQFGVPPTVDELLEYCCSLGSTLVIFTIRNPRSRSCIIRHP